MKFTVFVRGCNLYIDWLIYREPILDVAFYDRASTKPQSTNCARLGNCSDALEIADQLEWNLIVSGDERNGGVCFLDCCSGDVIDRPVLDHLIKNDEVNTIIMCASDRMARGRNAFDYYVAWARNKNKNLAILKNESDVNFENEILKAFGYSAGI